MSKGDAREEARTHRGVFIAHDVHHAYPVGDSFTLLNRGRSMGTFARNVISRDRVIDRMAGGLEMQKLMAEFGVRVRRRRPPDSLDDWNWP
jgi:ABC-type sugar transport system ATPase subunit